MAEKIKERKEELPKDTDQITGEFPKPIRIKKAEGMTAPDRATLEKFVVSDLMKRFASWESWRRPFETVWSEIYRMYLSVLRGQKTPTRAKVFVPLMFQVIEASLPKLVNAVVGELNFFDTEPIRDDAPKEDFSIALSIRRLIKFQLELMGFFLKFVEFGKQLLMYGTSYMFVFWKVKRAWVVERTPVRRTVTFFGVTVAQRVLSWKEERVFKVVERRPDIEVLDIDQVYPDPSATNEMDGRGFFIRSEIDMQDLEEMSTGKFPVYANFDQVRTLFGTRKDGHHPNQSNVVQDRRSIRGTTVGIQDKNSIELLSFWGKYDLDGDGIREEALLVFADRTVLIKAIPNPFDHQERPLIRSVLFNVPKEWYGIGMIEPVIPLQHELNTIRNQRLDNINLILNNMWKVNSLADVDLDALVASPNGIILTDDMSAVEALMRPDVTASAYNDASVIQQDIENTTAPRSIQGTPESGRLGRTARGAQLIIGQALEKFGLAARVTEESSIKRLLNLMHQLNGQFLNRDELLSDPALYGDIFNGQKVTPEIIRAKVKFKLLGISETIGKEAKINQLVSFSGIYKDVLGPVLVEVAKMHWRLMGFSGEDKLFPSAEEVGRIMGQFQQQQQPQQQQAVDAALRGQAEQTTGGASAPAVPGVGL